MSTTTKVLGIFVLIGLVIVGKIGFDKYQLMDPKPLTEWKASDAENTATINHQLWQEILTANVQVDETSGINLFNYGKFGQQDKQKLENYLATMQALNPRTYNDAEQMAYWINLYNAITIKVIVDEYPVTSIKQTGNGLPGMGPWDDANAVVDSQKLSLNDIEHGILRRVWQDNRIHYGVNCASIGCPNLSPVAFTGDNLDSQLTQLAKQFINHPRGVHYDSETNTLTLSSIFKWFISDFGNSEQALLADLQRHAYPALKTILKTHDGDIEYDYDWNLNGVTIDDK